MISLTIIKWKETKLCLLNSDVLGTKLQAGWTHIYENRPNDTDTNGFQGLAVGECGWDMLAR